MKTFYFLKNQGPLKFLKPSERAELDAADRAYRESEEGSQACRPFVVSAAEPWWAPHDGPECNVFSRPHADCDCSADLIG
jgi:hypothetical protein